jgi:hypothetical protein
MAGLLIDLAVYTQIMDYPPDILQVTVIVEEKRMLRSAEIRPAFVQKSARPECYVEHLPGVSAFSAPSFAQQHSNLSPALDLAHSALVLQRTVTFMHRLFATFMLPICSQVGGEQLASVGMQNSGRGFPSHFHFQATGSNLPSRT